MNGAAYRYRPVLDRRPDEQTIRERAEFLAHEIHEDRLAPEAEIADAIEIEIARFARAGSGHGVRNTVQAVRIRLGLTQLEVARRAKMAQSDLSAIENGRKIPGCGWRRRIARALQQSEAMLFPVDGQHS